MPLLQPSFVGCDASGGGASSERLKLQVDLVGAINGSNTVFTFPEFVVVDGVSDPAIYFMGQRLKIGATCDYTLSESGGAGTGYDTVTLAVAPPTGSNLFADYYSA